MSEIEAQVIDITDLDDAVINLTNDDISNDIDNNLKNNISNTNSSNFGPGIELLMNDKKKIGNENLNLGAGIELDDISKLENDLLNSPKRTESNKSNIFSNIFQSSNNVKIVKDDNNNETVTPKVAFSDLGKATSETVNNKKTWDGFGKFNNIPINQENEKPIMSEQEILN